MIEAYYVYEHWRPDTGVCFYVGKGRGRRAYQMRTNRNLHHERIVSKIEKMGLRVDVRMVVTGISEDEALRIEVERIAFWRDAGTNLTNMTVGGDGLRSPSEETLCKMRVASRKRWADPENRRIASEKTKKAHSSPEVRAKLGHMKGKRHSEETKRKIGEASRGFRHSEESKIKMSLWQIGRKMPREAVEKVAAAKRGKKLSEKTKLQMRLAQRLRRAQEAVLRPKPPKIVEKLPKEPFKHSPEAIERMKIAAKKRGVSEKTRAAQKLAVTGKKRAPFSDETIAKMRAAAAKREAAKRERREAA